GHLSTVRVEVRERATEWVLGGGAASAIKSEVAGSAARGKNPAALSLFGMISAPPRRDDVPAGAGHKGFSKAGPGAVPRRKSAEWLRQSGRAWRCTAGGREVISRCSP